MCDNRQYREMLNAAVRRMQDVDLLAAAARSGLRCDPATERVTLETFGRVTHIDAATLLPDPPVEMWLHLAILQYLESSDGSLPTERWIGMADLSEGGLARGTSFDREIDALIANRLGRQSPERIRAACERLGARFVDNPRADLCADFFFLPRFPLRLNLWYADDEFPASGKLLVNDGVKQCLGTEAIGTVGTLLIRGLCDACGESVL